MTYRLYRIYKIYNFPYQHGRLLVTHLVTIMVVIQLVRLSISGGLPNGGLVFKVFEEFTIPTYLPTYLATYLATYLPT